MVLGFKISGLARNPGNAPRSLNHELSAVGCGGRSRAVVRRQAPRGTLHARPVRAPGLRTRLLRCESSSCRTWRGDTEVTRGWRCVGLRRSAGLLVPGGGRATLAAGAGWWSGRGLQLPRPGGALRLRGWYLRSAWCLLENRLVLLSLFARRCCTRGLRGSGAGKTWVAAPRGPRALRAAYCSSGEGVLLLGKNACGLLGARV